MVNDRNALAAEGNAILVAVCVRCVAGLSYMLDCATNSIPHLLVVVAPRAELVQSAMIRVQSDLLELLGERRRLLRNGLVRSEFVEIENTLVGTESYSQLTPTNRTDVSEASRKS